jgi:peptidyl-prolyl cis-trans isomerase A (cyclophilin A)
LRSAFMKKLHLLSILCLFAATKIFAGPLVIFHTSLGDIEVELYEKDKPITVQNFLNYVEGGYYNGTVFHRCPTGVNGLTDFVLQGGEFGVVGGSSPFFYAIPNFPPIPDEFAVGTRYSNIYGTLAMAKAGGDTNSATSSWFFNLTNNSFLDAADTNNLFAVFGHVVRGTNILNQFIGRSYNNGLVNLGGPLSSVPVNYTGTNPPAATNFYYVTISALSPQVTLLTNKLVQITWTSINGLTNVLEYATNLPPVWQTFGSIVGNGGVVGATDPTTNRTSRFYRVRILY